MTDYIYDIETYPNVFTCAVECVDTDKQWVFEISYRRNDIKEFIEFIRHVSMSKSRMVGFNNVGFDYPVIHFIINRYQSSITPYEIYLKGMSIINSDDRFGHMIWDNERYAEQIDLFKIHHFDNQARSTSLKMLEFNMRMDNIEDLPFPPGTFLNSEQIDRLIYYNLHGDVKATKLFYIKSLPDIKFREQLSKKYDSNFMNHNDTKIGKDYFIMELERSLPGICYEYVNGKRKPRQTLRPQMVLRDAIFPWIRFKTSEFQRITDFLKSKTITETKGVFKKLTCMAGGIEYTFGTGGVHASMKNSIIESDQHNIIMDLDVTSYYPSTGIANRMFPEHLSELFCDIYARVKSDRLNFKKGTPENKALKLALNGVYGDSNSGYSPFYDSMYMLKITLNGQLLLCLLAEYLSDIPELVMIQCNTDGVSFRVPRVYLPAVDSIRKRWEKLVNMELEEARYSRMFIRDVNNYIAEYEGTRELKRKGAYNHTDLEWHKNHSSLIVPKAAEAYLVRNIPVIDSIVDHCDIMDFMRIAKVSRSEKLRLDGEDIQRISRYYISHHESAGLLEKVSPPAKNYKVDQWKRATKLTDDFYQSIVAELRQIKNPVGELDSLGLPWDERINTKSKTKFKTRYSDIDKGWNVKICNDIKMADMADINYEFYIAETEKLVSKLKRI